MKRLLDEILMAAALMGESLKETYASLYTPDGSPIYIPKKHFILKYSDHRKMKIKRRNKRLHPKS